MALGARIEKVYQPERDEIVLQMRSLEGGKRLQINAGSGNPRIGFTEINKENPQNPVHFPGEDNVMTIKRDKAYAFTKK